MILESRQTPVPGARVVLVLVPAGAEEPEGRPFYALARKDGAFSR